MDLAALTSIVPLRFVPLESFDTGMRTGVGREDGRVRREMEGGGKGMGCVG